jgi:hypothetical protein
MILKVPRGRASSSWGILWIRTRLTRSMWHFFLLTARCPLQLHETSGNRAQLRASAYTTPQKNSNRRATRTKAVCEDSSEPLRESAGPLGLVIPGMRTIFGSDDNEASSSAMSVAALGASTHSQGACNEAMADIDDDGAHLRGSSGTQ